MSVLKNDDVFKQTMINLKNAAMQWSFEKLNTVYDDPDPNSLPSQTDNYNYNPFSGSIGSPFAEYSWNTGIKGVIHSHFNGHLSIFSPQDLKDMYQKMLYTQVTDDFFYGVVTHSGTGYILQIKDRNAFIQFGNKYLADDYDFSQFEIDNFNEKYKIKTGNPVSLNELGFVKMMDKLNVGLNVYKATDLTFSDYQKLDYVNSQVKPSNCN